VGVHPELRVDGRRIRRPLIRKVTPRAALLGTLAGVSLTFISMRPALEMFLTPMIGMTCFAIILLSWFGGVTFGARPPGSSRSPSAPPLPGDRPRSGSIMEV